MKKLISLLLVASTFAAVLASCSPAPVQETASTSSDISSSINFLNSKLDDTSNIIVGDAETALSYGIDMTDFEDEGYIVRSLGDDTLLLGKTAAGVDRAVRDYVKHADEDGYTVTYGEGYRVKKLTVAENDIADYVILIPADADECVKFAASELEMFIERACGAKLKIVTKDPGNSRVIELRPEAKGGELGEEGFENTVSGGRVTIRGGNIRGCMYGVYDLLEDVLGYRFLTTTLTHLYESEHVDIPEGYSNRELPGFIYRYVYDQSVKEPYKGAFMNDGDFSARRRSNNEHAANQEKYGYAGIKNAHHGMSTYVKSVPDSSQPCLTADWVFEECLDNVMAYLEAQDAMGNIGTKVRTVDLGQNDNNGFCRCDDCKKAHRLYGSQSGLFADFTNRIAEEVSKEYPEILVGMFAYWGAIVPPKNIELHPNVQVCYVMYGYCKQHPLNGTECNERHTFQEGLNNIVHQEYLSEWQKLTKNIHVWFYTVNFWGGLTPFVNMDDYPDDFRFLAGLELSGIFDQYGYSKLTFDDLNIYLMTLLAWDPFMEEDEYYQHAQEFMMLFYGDGWEYLYEYLIHDCEMKNRLPCSKDNSFEWYANEYDTLKVYFDKATELCNTSEQEARIERLSIAMHYQAMCGLYEEKYVNGTAEEKAEMQKLSYWIRDTLVKYGVQRNGPESDVLFSDVCFDLSVLDPKDYNQSLTLVDPERVSEGLEYKAVGDGYHVSGIGTCENAEVIIPETYEGKSVTGIADSAFEDCTQIVEITMPDSITYLGKRAFADCTSLQKVTLSANIKEIPEFAFSGCEKLYSINIENVLTIGMNTFKGCTSLESVNLSGACSFGNFAFNESGLTSVTVANGVTELPQGIFGSCSNLKEVNLPQSLKKIGNSAFMSSGIESITIPDSVTEIEMYAFRYCGELTYIKLPATLKTLNDMMFEQCTSLETVIMSEGLERIEDNVFSSCESLETIDIPDTVTYIGDSCFQLCDSLKKVRLPEGLTVIPDNMFQYSPVEEVNIPSKVESIGMNAFFQSGIKSIALPDGCLSIGEGAFYECYDLSEVTFGKSLTEIGKIAFTRCVSLEKVILPDTVETIGSNAFAKCSALNELYLGSSVTDIDQEAFSYCTGLTSVFLPKSLKPASGEISPFRGCSGVLALYTDLETSSLAWETYFGRTTTGVSYEEYVAIIGK